MRKFKRLLAAVMVAAILATFLPVGVLAAEGDENPNPPSKQSSVTEETDEEPGNNEPVGEVPEITEIGVYVGGEYVKAVEDESSTFSLLPLSYKTYTLNLQGYLPSELKKIEVNSVIDKLKAEHTIGSDPKAPAVWARWNYYDEDGYHYEQGADFAVLKPGDTFDLSNRSSGYSTYNTHTLEMIVGTADQLDERNIRYVVYVQTTNGLYDLLEFSAKANSGNAIDFLYDPYWQSNSYYNDVLGYYQLNMHTRNWNNGKFKLSSDFNSNSYVAWNTNRTGGNALENKYNIKVFAGHYTKAENLPAGDITSQIWGSSATGYDVDVENSRNNSVQLTMVLYNKDDSVADIIPFEVRIYPTEFWVSLNEYIFKTTSYSNYAGYCNYNGNDYEYNGERDYTQTYRLYSNNSATGTYYVRMDSHDPETQKDGIENIERAYVGRLSQEDVTAKGDTDDIKASLFPSYSSNGGYAVDFSQYPNGITFTVLDNVDNNLWYITVKLREQTVVVDPLPPAPTPLSQDTYFRMYNAYNHKEENVPSYNAGDYNAYCLPYEHDTYYYRGYQTVFLLNGSSAVTDGTIYPNFYTHPTVDVFAANSMDDKVISGTKQEPGKQAVTFENGTAAVMYSAAAENGKHLKNYYVTFLTQTENPTLFINGMNDEANYQPTPATKNLPEDQQVKLPTRIVNLTSDYYHVHDIFFANLGKTALTGLSVELVGADGTGEAENVELDDYWTINSEGGASATTLGSFTTTTKTNSYGELPNVGKLRLVPKKDENGNIISGEISGQLVITYDGLDEPVRILLTGTAGELKIITDEILPAVKHVSYSSLIQTNYLSDGAADAVEFTATGLPGGMQIKPNGELYGVPTVAGTFPITITATCAERVNGQTVTRRDSKSYTLTIANNADMTVWDYDKTYFGDSTYTPTIAIPNENYDGTNIGTNASSTGNSWENVEQEIYCAGAYGDFLDRVFLDSVQLIPGVDYTSEDGSTRIVIKTQTLRSQGNGTHTISAEFRSGQDPDATLRRTAQNYTLTTLGINNNTSSSSSSSSNTRYTINTTTKVQNGTYTSNMDKATEGTRVTITLSPAYGYEPDQVIVTDKDGKQVPVTKAGDNKYTFRMPASKVDIKVTFKLKEYVPGISGPFVDVDPNAWYADAINYVYENGLMVGVGGYAFEPNAIVERSMLVTVLHNLEDQPDNAVSYFSDVPLNQWYTKPVSWAVESGIISGYGDGRFGPSDSLTREQMAVILYNYARMKGYDMSQQNNLNQFVDADSVSDFAHTALQWANAVGLINGYGNGILDPQGSATRAQLAMILMNFCENIM